MRAGIIKSAGEAKPQLKKAPSRLVEYAPEHFNLLSRAAAKTAMSASLTHRPFVDYYYTTSQWCRLYLFLGDDGEVAGTLGADRMRFEYLAEPLTLSFGSNFFAFQQGAGGLLFMRWMMTDRYCAAFGGSPDTHVIIRNQGWTYYGGVKIFFLNRSYKTLGGDPLWRAGLKWGARALARPKSLKECAERMPADVRARLCVREETACSEEMLPRRSPFSLRFAPTTAYLNWRYSTGLSFVRYRVFRIMAGGESVGYVIINESPDRLIVAQCDAGDAATLACGVMLALVEVSQDDTQPREVLLTSSHPAMQRIYSDCGFRAERERPFAIGSRRGGAPIAPDTSEWLINYDWTDNGLRPPFMDQR